MADIDRGFVAYGKFTPDFVDDLAASMSGQRVLEIFGGNGLLASLLSARGVDIVSTSLFTSHDGHESGFAHPVIEMEAVEAVQTYGDEADILLMSWPTVTEATTKAVLEWGSERPVVFIGEITRPDLGRTGLGGCATDAFFKVTELEYDIASYQRSFLDRAVFLKAKAQYVEQWRGRTSDAWADIIHRPL